MEFVFNRIVCLINSFENQLLISDSCLQTLSQKAIKRRPRLSFCTVARIQCAARQHERRRKKKLGKEETKARGRARKDRQKATDCPLRTAGLPQHTKGGHRPERNRPLRSAGGRATCAKQFFLQNNIPHKKII